MQLNPGDRLGTSQRAHEDIQPIRAGIGGQAKIGHHEPLRSAIVPLVDIAGAGGRRQHVDAGLALGQHLIDREACHHILIDILGDVDRPLPDKLAVGFFDLVGGIAVHLGQKLRIGHQRRYVALTDAEQFEIGAGRIDRDDRNAATGGGRQHKAVAGETNGGRTVLHIDVEINRRFQHFINGGWQSAPQRQPITLAMAQTLHADLLVLGFQRLGCGAVQCHERRIVRAFFQRFRKLHAGTRAHAIGVHRMFQNPEAPAFAQIIEPGLNRAGVDERQAFLQRIDCTPMVLLGLERFADLGQGVGAQRRRA